MEEIPSTHPDVLVANVTLGNCSFRMIITYASTNDDNRNKNIYDVIYKNIENLEINEKLLILGDLNGHIGILGPQKINKNGKKILDLVEKYNLGILNLDPKCSGEITRQQGDFKSTIDFAICNEEMQKLFLNMFIDDEWEVLKISDHNLISIDFSYKKSSTFCDKNKIIKFNRKSEEHIDNYLSDIQKNIADLEMDINQLNNIIVNSQNKNLEKTIIKRDPYEKK